MAEFALIDLIRARTAMERADVRVGIGDDGAVLAVPAFHELVVSTDTLVEGVHFPLGTAASDLGWKALAVNLSDLAAMGATPAWATLALTLPRDEADFVAAFADGFAALARESKLALVGGDTTRGPLSVTVTVHGFVPEGEALLRRGARPGDRLFVTGSLGDAAAGLACLDPAHARAADLMGAAPGVREALIARLNRPTPRLAQGLALRGLASAAIDLSDGLLADLAHVCRASGVGAVVEALQLPTSSALLGLFDANERWLLQTSGDDYELCFAVPEARCDEAMALLARTGGGATCVGRVVEGAGVRLVDAQGELMRLPRAGWDHFTP
jgi:thiamine-monophosphate kinase